MTAEAPVEQPIQWVNKARTVLITMWPDGAVSVALRDHPNDLWGPPTDMEREW